MKINLSEDFCCTRLECQYVETNCSEMFNEHLFPANKRNPKTFLQSHIIYELALYATSPKDYDRRTSSMGLGKRSAGYYGANNSPFMPWDMSVIDAYVALDESYADEKAEALIKAGFKFVRGVHSLKYRERPLLIFSGFPPIIFRKAIRSFRGLSHCVRKDGGYYKFQSAYKALYETRWVKDGCPDGGTISLKDALTNYRNDIYETEEE